MQRSETLIVLILEWETITHQKGDGAHVAALAGPVEGVTTYEIPLYFHANKAFTI